MSDERQGEDGKVVGTKVDPRLEMFDQKENEENWSARKWILASSVTLYVRRLHVNKMSTSSNINELSFGRLVMN